MTREEIKEIQTDSLLSNLNLLYQLHSNVGIYIAFGKYQLLL